MHLLIVLIAALFSFKMSMAGYKFILKLLEFFFSRRF